MLRPALLAFLAGALAPTLAAADPVLNFSDLTSGPKSGNSDTSLGQTAGQDGAIVTIWGTRLGGTQGSSKVFIGGAEAAKVYYWGNATPPYSTADLNKHHRIQVVIAQVCHAAADGPGTIMVTVDGQASNSLPFTVRPGRIGFVKSASRDGGDGSWTNPWTSIPLAVKKMAAGDITYVCTGVKQISEDENRAAVNLAVKGERDRPVALVAYPGADVSVGSDKLSRGFHSWISGYGPASHWVISKFSIRAGQDAVVLNSGYRVVGNLVTAPTGSAPAGAIEGSGNDLFVLGNEVTRVGKPGASKLYHPIYISSRRINSGPRLPTEANREIAWNYLHDNNANCAINIYSEGSSTAFMSGHRVHDNFVIDQVGSGMLLGQYMTGENWVYNNVVVHAGLGPEPTESKGQNHIGVQIEPGVMGGPPTTLYFYNNTIYDCGWAHAAWGPSANGAISFGSFDRYQLVFSNNIICSTGQPYLARRPTLPGIAGGRNLWFGAGAPPRWDTEPVHADPLFVNAAGRDYRLQARSPGLDRGLDVRAIVSRDINGVARPQGSGFDLGAYEFAAKAKKGEK